MMSYRRPADSRPSLAAESGGAYDDGSVQGQPPLERMAAILVELEDVQRRALAAWRDVTSWGGTASTTGYRQGEWLALVGRLSGGAGHRLELLARRLPALPVTAALLHRGQLTVDQAYAIAKGTTRLNGDRLAEVEQTAAELAADRNRRSDHPDIDVDRLVQAARKPAEQERIERRALDGPRVTAQQDFDGGGRLFADLDAEGFATTLAAIEDAAGTPSPDEPRSRQRAEGMVAMSRAWLAGRDTHPLADTDDGAAPDLPLGAAGAKPTVVVKVDLADATPAAFGQLWRTAAGRHAPMLAARAADTLACNADLILAVCDGHRPLAEFKQTRGLPDRIRRQVLWRDSGCRWPGCTAPPWQCDVHHLDEDPTNHAVDNLAGLCRRHHRRLHTHFWHPTLDGHTGRLGLARTEHGDPVHTTYPHGTTRPGTADPPEVAVPR